VSYEQFCYSIARHAAAQADVKKMLGDLFGALDAIVDEQLAVLYRQDDEMRHLCHRVAPVNRVTPH